MWENSKIGADCLVGDGAHASITRVDKGKLYLSAKNFSFQGIKLNDVSYISEDDFKKYFNPNSKALTKPKSDDLILGIIGAGLGVPFLIDDSLEEFGVSSSVALIRANTSVIYPKYLFYWMVGDYFQTYLKQIQSGSAQGFLSLEMIRSLPLNYPNYDSQKKIASILSAYDDIIENNNQRIQLLEEMAAEIYKEWFVRFRFAGYKEAKFLDKEGKKVAHGTKGAMPEGWEKKPIKDIVDIISGYAFKTASFEEDGDYGLVTIKNVQNGYFVTKTTDYIKELPKNLKEDILLKEKDILLSLTGNIGRICLVYGENYLLNQRVAKLKPKTENLFEYVYLFFRSDFLRMTLENYSNGAAQQNLSPVDTSELKFITPPDELLEKFSGITKSFFDEIIILLKKNKILQETRDLLLPRLISGKLSVEELEIEEKEKND